tara:strand:+ start:2116 stop:2946 length:831 start_codon:yes stop_codon:yes gene_type:complete
MSCEAQLKSGLRKGEKCNCKTKQGNKYCGKHKNYDSNKNIEKKENKNKINNETIGIAYEKAWCIVSDIDCNYEEDRINYEYVNKFIPKIKVFLKENPKFIALKHIGIDNGNIDFIIQDNKTLSLKTLKKYDGKICPQNIGQPTYKRFDEIWGLEYEGKYEKNPLRLEFITTNINIFLNKMFENLFCCDWEIVGYNCEKNIKIDVLKKPTNMNYFDNLQLTFTRPKYEEKWNEIKQKNSEYSSIIKLNGAPVGELQFHKTSRQVIKFRFFSKFLNTF